MNLYAIWTLGLFSGFFSGIFITTGQSIDPIDIILQTGDLINESLSHNAVPSPNYWAQFRPLVLIIAASSTIVTILSIFLAGIKGVFVAGLSFSGAFLLVFGVNNFYLGLFGFLLLIFGAVISRGDTT